MRSLSPSPAQPVMKALTREMVIEKHNLQNTDMGAVKKMNMFDFKIDNINLLREMKSLEIVSLSENRISTLRDLAHCPNIQELYIRKNNIFDLQEVAHLAGLKHLKVLWFAPNPCSEHPYYRPYIVRKLPYLIKLDNAEISKEERQAASRINFEQIFKETPSVTNQRSKSILDSQNT